MGWIDNLKERAFKVFFKEEAKKIELLEQKYEELKSDKELNGIYNNLTSDYDILEEKFLETLNELNEYKQINKILTYELNCYRENGISHNEEKEIDDTKEHIITKDLYLEDGSFIEKGTSFFIEGFKDGKYNIHFENNLNNKYHNELGDDYLFNSKELSDFSNEAWNLSITENLTQYDLNNILDLELKEFNELVQALIPENDKDFMEKRNLRISSYTQEYLNQAKEHDFEKEDFMSFYSYLDRGITGIMELEYDRYNEETYMERYEDTVLGEKKHIDLYEKSNVVDNCVPYLKKNNKNIGIELDIFKSKNNELEME